MMNKANSSLNFLRSLRSKLHHSKGEVAFGTPGRLHADWRTLLITYLALNLIIVVDSVFLFFNINNYGQETTDGFNHQVKTFEAEELFQAVEHVNQKSAERQGLGEIKTLPRF